MMLFLAAAYMVTASVCKCCFFRINSVDTSEQIFTKLWHMTCLSRQ